MPGAKHALIRILRRERAEDARLSSPRVQIAPRTLSTLVYASLAILAQKVAAFEAALL